MKPFFTQLGIQFKGDLRDKGVLMVYYLVPLAFYLVMGSVMKVLDNGSGNSLIMSMTIFALSMSAYLGMPQTLVKAREDGVLEAYRVAGIPAWSLPLATIVISFVHMMLIACVILFSAPYLFKAAWPSSMDVHLLSVALIAVCSQALGTLLSCLVEKQNTLTLVGQCLFMPTVMLSGIMFPVELLPRPMQLFGQLLPATQGMLLVSDAGMAHLPLAILAAIALTSFGISVARFKRISMRK